MVSVATAKKAKLKSKLENHVLCFDHYISYLNYLIISSTDVDVQGFRKFSLVGSNLIITGNSPSSATCSNKINEKPVDQKFLVLVLR